MREEMVEDLKGMAELASKTQSGQKYMDAIFALMIDNTAGVGMSPLKKMNRKLMLQQGLVKPETDEEKQMLAQQAQQAQQPSQQDQLMAAMSEEAKGKGIEAQAEAKKTEIWAFNLSGGHRLSESKKATNSPLECCKPRFRPELAPQRSCRW